MPDPSQIIRVEFLHAASGQPFSVSEAESDELPDVFDTDSEIELAGKRYEIVEAVPALRRDYEKSGAVCLWLRELEIVDPATVLFSLPTLDDSNPDPGRRSTGSDKRFAIHEDDWRQIEFVSMSHLPGIRAELGAIENVYREHRRGGGFREVHLRKEIGAPLFDTLLPLDKARKELGSRGRLKGLGYGGDMRLVEDGFAFETDLGMTFFGLQINKIATTLCCSVRTPPSDPRAAAERLAKFTAKHRLVYVDWCWMVAVNEDEAEFSDYFARLQEGE